MENVGARCPACRTPYDKELKAPMPSLAHQAKAEARKQKSRDRVRDREARDSQSSGGGGGGGRVSVIGGGRGGDRRDAQPTSTASQGGGGSNSSAAAAAAQAQALTFGSAHLPVFGAPITLSSSTLTERQTAGIALERASLQVCGAQCGNFFFKSFSSWSSFFS